MAVYRAEALVLGKTKLGETDLILTMLSAEDSQIRAVAKGSRKPGSRLTGLAEPFTVLDILLYQGKNLDTITEAKALETYSGIRADYDRLMAGSVALELAMQLTNDGDHIPRLYAMTRAYLDALTEASEEALTPLLTAYLLKALAMAGYSPEFELCSRNDALRTLFVSTFSDIIEAAQAEREVGDSEGSTGANVLLSRTINFAEKHLPARLKSLSHYRKH